MTRPEPKETAPEIGERGPGNPRGIQPLNPGPMIPLTLMVFAPVAAPVVSE